VPEFTYNDRVYCVTGDNAGRNGSLDRPVDGLWVVRWDNGHPGVTRERTDDLELKEPRG
jgi:hypothetical protein